MHPLNTAANVLRSPADLITDDTERLTRLAPTLVGLTMAGIGLWAGVVGGYRGGIQMLYAPLKAPLLLFIPLAVCLPAMRALFDRDGIRLNHATVASAGLVGAARSGLLASALAPVLWLWLSIDPGYHEAVLATAVTLALAGIPGLWTIASALRGPRSSISAAVLSVMLLGVVTAQTGWMLRPFVVRPTATVELLRPMEADIASALLSTADSANGSYNGWEAEPAGVLGRGLHKEDR